MKYTLVKDKDGIPIHTSPPYAPWCPGIYRGEDGSFAFVGEALDPGEALTSGINLTATEIAVKVSRDHIKRLIDAYVAGTLDL